MLLDSFGQLKGAVGNFSTSLRLLGSKPDGHEGKGNNCNKNVLINVAPIPALVPLTTSVYVDAVLEEPERVLIDVGTGYYIEQVQICMYFLLLTLSLSLSLFIKAR